MDLMPQQAGHSATEEHAAFCHITATLPTSRTTHCFFSNEVRLASQTSGCRSLLWSIGELGMMSAVVSSILQPTGVLLDLSLCLRPQAESAG